MWKIIRIFVSVFVAFETLFTGIAGGIMPKSIDINVQCPFYKGEGKDYIACEGVINGTVDKHFFKNIKEKGMFENNVCSSECGRRCIHYKRVNELYEKGLR